MLARIGSPVSGWVRHLTRQRQELQGLFQIHLSGGQALGQGRALGLLAFAELDEGAEAAVAQGHLLGPSPDPSPSTFTPGWPPFSDEPSPSPFDAAGGELAGVLAFRDSSSSR